MTATPRLTLVAASALEAPANGRMAVLIPVGTTKLRDGSTFILDQQAADGLLVKLRQRTADLLIDWDGEEGGSYGKLAAGWIKRNGVSFDSARGLVSRVDFTPRGARAVHNQEVRYLSPTVTVDTASRRVVGIEGFSLTNRPASDMLPPLPPDSAGESPALQAASNTRPAVPQSEGGRMARTRTQIIAAAKAANANAGLAPDTLRILIDTRLAAAGMPRMTAREAGELVTGSDSQPTASGPRAELSAASPAGQSRAYLLDSFRRQYRSDPAIRKVTSSERSFVNGSLIAASQPALTDDEARSLCLVG